MINIKRGVWLRTNAEDLIKNPHFCIEMVIIVSWQHNDVSHWKWQWRVEFEVIEQKHMPNCTEMCDTISCV